MAERGGRTAGRARQADSELGVRTRDAVAACVGRGQATVEEIATALELTLNAVRFHLGALERDGTVRRDGAVRTGGVGKPRDVYVLTEAAEERRSSAYAPVLAAVVDEVSQCLDPDELAPLLVRAGASLASGVERPARAGERVRKAAALLEELGGVIDVVRTRDAVVLRGHGCPLSTAVARQPAVCLVMAGMLSELTGTAVVEECDHGARPSCRFRVPRPASQPASR